MTATLWTVILVQMAMGAFDTLFHHEGTERLAWRPGQAGELRLHGCRNLLYAVMFMALGWSEPRGAWALALAALLAVELVITLWDFVEEDRTRRLPATERVLHTLLTLNYGVALALLAPVLVGWARLPTALAPAWHGWLSWLCLVASVGVTLSGVRDLLAAARAGRLAAGDPARLVAALQGRWSVLVTGGTGFVGRRLVEALVAGGHEVTVLTRRTPAETGLPAPVRIVSSLDQIAPETPIGAIVNLAGEPIADAPWTVGKRRRILASRLRVTRAVVRLAARLDRKPAVLVSGSAVGWYGVRGDEPLDEAGDGRACFSRRVCVAWEGAAAPAAAPGMRTVLLRTGLVLGSEGGVLSRMLTPFEFGLGGRFGDGRQWMSWIARDDLVRLIAHAVATPTLEGPVNAVAPEPVTNAAFARALGRALGRPALLPVPAAPLRAVLGDLADELLLGGQRVLPAAALASGFRLDQPALDGALARIVGRPATRTRAAAPAPARLVRAASPS